MKCLHPAHWPRPKGYSNGVVANGRTIFISGMIGWDAQGKMVSRDFVGQVRQILRNIVEVLSEANAKPENIVRMNWYVLDKKEYVDSYKQLGIVYREDLRRSLSGHDRGASQQPDRGCCARRDRSHCRYSGLTNSLP